AMGIHKEFIIPPSDAFAREERIRHISDELGKVLAQAPLDSDMRMSMNIQAHKPGVSETGEGRRGRDGKISKVSYQPRAVGNDMGLWVMGSAWVDLVHEAMPRLLSELSATEGENTGIEWAILGLGQVILGEADDALESFSSAVSAGSEEMGLLGSVVAWIEKGEEDMAIAACEEVLKINPKNRAARDNLKWLKTPSVIKE
ncbi:unnamed protein product, partial [marine sediment metagenome]